MTWEIIAALIALATIGITIGKVVANNTSAITRLTCAVETLTQSSDRQEKRMSMLEDKIASIDNRLGRMEGRND